MRLHITIPEDDPRFNEIREMLAEAREQARQKRRNNPASRMLVEWALMGFLFTHGRLGFAIPPGDDGLPAPLASTMTEPVSASGTPSEAAPAEEQAPPLREDDIDSVLDEAGWGFE